MDNLHVRLHFNLSKEKGINLNTTAKNNIMKLVKLQNLVAKCCKAWKNMVLQNLQIFSMFVLPAEIVTIFSSKMVTISARNTNILKICKLRKAIFTSSLREFFFFA
jgi:hypothetical protein